MTRLLKTTEVSHASAGTFGQAMEVSCTSPSQAVVPVWAWRLQSRLFYIRELVVLLAFTLSQ